MTKPARIPVVITETTPRQMPVTASDVPFRAETFPSLFNEMIPQTTAGKPLNIPQKNEQPPSMMDASASLLVVGFELTATGCGRSVSMNDGCLILYSDCLL